MARRLELIPIGDEAGVILPDDVLARLGVGVGDALSIREVAFGIELARFDGAIEQQMQPAREIMARRRDALRKLGTE